MAFSVQDLYADKCQKYGAGEGSEDFQFKVMEAINLTIGDLTNECQVSVSLVDSLEDDIALDTADYKGVVSTGVDYYLHHYNEYNILKLSDIEKLYFRLLKRGKRVHAEDSTSYGPKGDLS